MSHNNFQINQNETYEHDECISKGICSISPRLSSLHEVVLLYLKELSFYLLELQKFGITNRKIEDNILDSLSGLVVNIEFQESKFNEIISKIYGDLLLAKELYISLCEKNKLEPTLLKSKLKISKTINLSDAIRQGYKYAAQKTTRLSAEQKNLFEIILIVVKSACIHLVELKGFDVEKPEAYKAILSMLSIMNFNNISNEKLHETIKNFVETDHTLLEELQKIREEKYGQISPTEVSLNTRANKAILVSGTDMRELELLLKATQNKGIDVYTHGHMIMAHAFPKLKAYPHLVGHYGKGVETYLIDFASFPGVVFMTRHSFQRTENLYRSRVFTTDIIASKGVTTIQNGDFGPLIESALSAKGFTKGIEQKPLKINMNEEVIVEKITEVAEKIESGEIKHFFAIGISNTTKAQEDYFKKFLNLLTDDCFALSFSYSNGAKNVLNADTNYGFPILYKALDILTKKLKISELNPIILFTRCEVHTISNLLHLKYMGINKIYFTNCSPTLINPSLVTAIREMFDIKSYTNPEDDFKAMTAD